MSTVITDDWMSGWGAQQQPSLDLISDGGTILGAAGTLDLFSNGHTTLSAPGALDLFSYEI